MSETISSTTFMRNIGEFVSKAVSGETVHVLAHGRPTVVVISAKEYESLCEARRQLSSLRLARLIGNRSTEPQ